MTEATYPKGLIGMHPHNPQLGVREDWLALHQEQALEPELPILDAHHHLWDRPDSQYYWSDFERESGGHSVKQSVFVECRTSYDLGLEPALQSLGETRFAAEQANSAKQTGIAAAIIGFVDLSIGDLAGEIVDRHQEIADGSLRGIRNIIAHSDDPGVQSTIFDTPAGFLAMPETREGLACLAPRGLTFETWAYFTQLPELLKVATDFADLTVIIDHIGGPIGVGSFAAKGEEVFAEWKRNMADLARRPNTRVKFSGIGMRVMGFGLAEGSKPKSSQEIADRVQKWFDTLLELFGPDRMMFASNFPVDKGAVSYVVLWNAFKRLTKNLSIAERTALFSGTSAQAYKLEF